MKYKIPFLASLLLLLTTLALLGGCTPIKPASADIPAEITSNIPIVPEPSTDPCEISDTTDIMAQTTAADTSPMIPDVFSETTSIQENETTAITESVQPTRIAVPRLSGQTREEAETVLQNAGIPYTVIESYSDQYEKGTVIKLQFYGVVDDQFCYVNPNYPTELIVSIGRRWKTNVTALDAKRIYLTFDDGPHHNTDRVLEILDTYGAKATFFTLGSYVAVYPERTKAISDNGHLLACHSYSHNYMKLYESADSVLAEIAAWENAVEKADVPLPPTVFFRFPGGTTTSYMKQDRYEDIFWAITDAGYLTMDWTCANNDRYPQGKTEEQTVQDFLKASTVATLESLKYSPTIPKVMLMHDTADETVEVLPWILEYLIGEGYTFGTLDELNGYWVFH